ncbi:LysR family transcriptional regulator [Rhodococcus triatomae]|uniref:DNA-binding transcriptional regulator, LysR family n=1 Tax=Rhodococcus triatomae TaxID=300028 RepID=A0A1G8MCQ3_9NOCA|nr:LysR substrate-binding domain-containing protein [Rhodococcus triatomae]QNG18134.1 LysR family transcriptional regulator [Rhodococcus triatomae]QNG22196.1 LysR family transcriptional regulator [Rhodococcus triatomae]SDI65635.1 DNA-binding transcriptional regulator, LysR family [Rhodococcus triatomae]
MSRIDNAPAYTMRQLAAFVAVAETGTISGAAERVHQSQSALSAAVTDLEKALGVQLCVRRRARGIQLTPTGEAVLTRARLLLQQASELQDDASGASGEVSGPVAVGCHPELGALPAPSIVAAFTARYPRARVAFREETQNRLRAQIEDGELDVAIVYDLDLPHQWRTQRLASLQPTVALDPRHRWASGDRPVVLAELADEPMVLLDVPPGSHHVTGVCRQAGFAPRIAYRTASPETARAFVARGLGWTLLLQRPRIEVTSEGLDVVVKPVAGPSQAVDVVLAWHAEAVLSRVAREFVAFAGRAASTPPTNQAAVPNAPR